MKRFSGLIILTISLFVSSCERTDNNPDYPYEAEVLGSNIDCGLYKIRFTDDLDRIGEKIGSSVIDGIYIAENIPEDLKHEGLSIILDVREPQPSELGVCTTMGPSLTWLHVINAKLR